MEPGTTDHRLYASKLVEAVNVVSTDVLGKAIFQGQAQLMAYSGEELGISYVLDQVGTPLDHHRLMSELKEMEGDEGENTDSDVEPEVLMDVPFVFLNQPEVVQMSLYYVRALFLLYTFFLHSKIQRKYTGTGWDDQDTTSGSSGKSTIELER